MEIKQETAVEKGEDSTDKQTEAPARVLTKKDRTDLFKHLESFLSFFQDRGHNKDCHWSEECCQLIPSFTVAYSAISKIKASIRK